MKLRSFVLKKASRAEQISKRVSPELISAIKKMDPKEIRKLFRGFVPLDFVALVQKQNGPAFEEALRNTIAQQLSTEQHKKWIEELGVNKEDAIGEVYISMLNDDPKKRGILSEILLDGSYSDAFQYARKAEPQLRLQLRQSLEPLASDNGIVVPFCPIDKSLGISWPLWNIKAEGDKVDIEQGLDDEGHCFNVEEIRAMSAEEFEALKATKQGLSEKQKEAIEQGKRSLEYKDGKAYLRCTFHTQLPKFQSFLHARSGQALKSVLDPERRKMGRTIPPAKFKRKNELEAKEKSGTLSFSEKSELRQIREYFQKKGLEFVQTPSSLDVSSDGDEGEGRSRHEMVSVESDEVFDSADEARLELSRRLGDKEFHVLSEISQKVPLGSLLNKMKSVMNVSSKDPQKKSLEKEVVVEALKAAQKYYGQDRKTENKCNTCSSELGSTANSCPYADQMRATIFAAYDQAKDATQFENAINQLDQKSKTHYQASELSPIVNNAFGGTEVEEDDSFGDLDLSGFESYQEDHSVNHQKLDSKQFKQSVENSLVSEQKKSAYYGTDVSSNLEITEDDVNRVAQLGQYLNKVIQDVFNQELEDELATYLIGYGAP